MARKEPLPKTVKRLFALSGNVCAYKGCDQCMVDPIGTVVGQICHIEGAEPGGERYNPNQSDDERRAFENLILLCANHHIITNDVEVYTVPILQKMKSEHENSNLKNQYVVSDESVARAIIQYQSNYIQSNVNSGTGVQINANGENVTQLVYINQNDESQELGIIEEIFLHVNEKISEGAGKNYKPEPSINLTDKIALNFKSPEEQIEVNDYIKNALLKIDLINRRFQILDPEDQKDIHAHISIEYNILKRNNGTNIEILTALFKSFVPTSKQGNSRYVSLAMAFVLYFFDDCTIFEKTDKEKTDQIKLNLE